MHAEPGSAGDWVWGSHAAPLTPASKGGRVAGLGEPRPPPRARACVCVCEWVYLVGLLTHQWLFLHEGKKAACGPGAKCTSRYMRACLHTHMLTRLHPHTFVHAHTQVPEAAGPKKGARGCVPGAG